MWRRKVATGRAVSQSSCLKRYLTRLYLKIHPDLLNQHPIERAVNESSFQRLQEVLKEHESTSEDKQYARPLNDKLPGILKFYFRGPSESLLPSEEHGLRQTSVAIRQGKLGEALHELFVSIGLDPPPAHLLVRNGLRTGNAGVNSSGTQTDSISLSNLVRQARQFNASSSGMRSRQDAVSEKAEQWREMDSARDSNIARLVIKRSRGVTVNMGDGLPKNRGESIAISRLNFCLDRCRDVDLTGLTVTLDGGFDVRLHAPTSSLTLGLCVAVGLWEAALRAEATATAAADRRRLSATEHAAANSIGVNLMFYENDFGSQLDSRAAEQNLADYKKVLLYIKQNPDIAKSEELSDLSVMVFGSSRDTSATLLTDDVEGLIKIPLAMGGQEVLRMILQNGSPLAIRHARMRARMESKRAQVARLCRALRIRSIRRADDVSDLQWNTALDDLWRNSGRIGGLLDRTNLVVGVDARVVETGEVQVPWNFGKILPL
jgi:hypothetical protein